MYRSCNGRATHVTHGAILGCNACNARAAPTGKKWRKCQKMAEKRPKMGQKSPHGQPHGEADPGCPSVLTCPVQPPRCGASAPTDRRTCKWRRSLGCVSCSWVAFFRWSPETHVTVGRFSRFSRFCNACQPLCNAWPTPPWAHDQPTPNPTFGPSRSNRGHPRLQ